LERDQPVLNIVVVGVGGQGLITLSNILARAALKRGYNAIVAETHGLSQRGGTVIVHVRLGDAEAPLVAPATARLMLAMELIEAVRYSSYLSPGGVVVANDYIVPPPLPGVKTPPRQALISALEARAGRLVLVEATRKALELGDARTANMILLGRALKEKLLEPYVTAESVEEVVRELWPKAYELNIKALHAG